MANIDHNFFNIDDEAAMKQNTIDSALSEGEEILVRMKPNKKVFVVESIFKGLPVALIWAAIDTFIIIMMAQSGFFNEMGPQVFLVIGFFALHLIPVWMFVANIVKRVGGYKNVEYALTDRRVIVRSGLIGIDLRFFYYSEIETVNVKVGILDRIFKVGDLYLTSHQQTVVMDDIRNPYQYASKIQEIVRDLKADMQFPNDLRPEENHGYNTKYRK